MAKTLYQSSGPIVTTAEKYEAMRTAGTLETGREYRIVDWEAQEKLVAGTGITIASDGKTISSSGSSYTAGTGIDITNNVISLDSNASIAIYDNRIADANGWLTNGYTKTRNVSEEYETATANLPSVCTGNSLWGVLLYIAENNSNYAGLQQYFPIDGTYKGRVFYRSVTGTSSGGTPIFGTWYMLPWDSEKQDVITSSNKLSADLISNGTSNILAPALPADASSKTYTLQAVNGTLTWVETTWGNND